MADCKSGSYTTCTTRGFIPRDSPDTDRYMPSSPRVQVLLRPDVYEIVKELSEEENITLSKVCGLLVEQALVNRGLWDKKRKIKPSMDPDAKSLHRLDVFDTKVPEPKDPEPAELDPSDLKLLKKIKALKEAGLL